MPTLILEEFHCIVETDEAGWDSPYFIVFVGQRTGNIPTCDVYTIRQDSWDNDIGSGDSRKVNFTIPTEVDTDTLVFVALMEEDDNADITGRDLANVRDWMKAMFQAFGSVNGLPFNQLGSKMYKEFNNAIAANITDDDCVAVQRVIIPDSLGPIRAVNFWGVGGRYWVRFRLVEPAVSVPIPKVCKPIAEEIKGLKKEKEALTKELAAAAPGEKPAINAQIKEKNAQIAKKQQELNACIAKNS